MISFSYSGDGRGDEHGNELRPTLRPEAREAHAHPVMRDVYARYDPLRLLSPLDRTSPTPSDSILVVLGEIHSWRAALFLVHGNNSCATRRGKKEREEKEEEHRQSPFILFHGLEQAWKSFAGSSPFGWMFRCSVGGETCANRFVIVSMVFS